MCYNIFRGLMTATRRINDRYTEDFQAATMSYLCGRVCKTSSLKNVPGKKLRAENAARPSVSSMPTRRQNLPPRPHPLKRF